MPFDKALALTTAKEYMLQSNTEAAIEIYRKIVQADPEDLTSISTLGELYARTDRVREAVSEFSGLADSYLASGFTRKAIAVFKRIMTIDPGNATICLKLADLYAKAGLPTEARQHYLQIADAYCRNGQMPEAFVVYRKVVDLDPTNASTRIKVGELYLREGLNDEAFEAFITAARQLAARGERRRALNAYYEALSIRADSQDATAAVAELTKGHSELSNGPSPVAALGNSVSEAAVSSGNLDQPNKSAPPNSVDACDSASVIPEISRAEILVAYGKVNQALSMLREVARKLPDNIDVRGKLKDIYLRNGMTAEGAGECRELERIYRALGENDRARDYAVRANRLSQLIEPSGDLHERKPQPSPDAATAQEPASILKQTSPRRTTESQAPASARESKAGRALQPAIVQRQARETATAPKPQPAAEYQPGAAPQPVIATGPPLAPQPPILQQSARDSRPDPELRTPAAVYRSEDASRDSDTSIATRLAPGPVGRDAIPNAPLVANVSARPLATLVESPRTAAPLNLVCDPSPQIDKPMPIAQHVGQPGFGDAPRKSSDSMRTAFQSDVVNSPRFVKKRSRLAVASMAAGVLAVLGTGAVIGGFLFDSRLDKQYEELSMASPSVTVSSPPVATPEEIAPPQTEEAVTVFGASAEKQQTVSRNENSERKTAHELPGAAATSNEPATPAARLAPPRPSLPNTAVTSDSRAGGDNRSPAGVQAGVPTGPATEPPPNVVRVSQGVVSGGAVKRVEPVYPHEARNARQFGTVRVEVSIDERGSVTGAQALSGPVLLRSAALAAARGWKFKPTTIGGVPVKTTTVLVFNFNP